MIDLRLCQRRDVFTLIELLVVIAIIAVLAGIAFPVFQSVQNAAKKTQAKNDLVQMVTAVNAFYTEYGRYPATANADGYFGPGPAPTRSPAPTKVGTNNDALFDILRNIIATTGVAAANPRGIVYLEVSAVKNDAVPRSGIASTGAWYDPWGSAYSVVIDGDYNNQVTNPYTDTPGGNLLTTGVIAWSLGLNGALGGGPAGTGFTKESGSANNYVSSSDAISWQ